mgnify:CR=1 FL=1
MESIGDIATVTVHIKKIREKIEFNTAKPQYIETIWAWDIDLRFKDVRVRSMKPRCAYTRVVLWHRLTPVFTRRNIMQEVKTPKKPFIYYLIIAATIMILLNTLVFPNVLKHQVKEVGYNVFMQMTNNQEIGSVNITDSEIFFTNKDNSQMYKTGVINDPDW